METSSLPVVVIGAGPVGLAAAAHLVVRGMPVQVLEAAAEVGGTFASVRQVALFSPWAYNTDRAARALLAQSGWQAPPGELLPTGGELVDRYLAPLAALPALRDVLRLRHRVLAITRQDRDKMKSAARAQAPFVLRVETPDGEVRLMARAVIDTSGTWTQPNPLGADGLPAPGEAQCAARIVHGMPDVAGTLAPRYAGKHVLVVGAGHSAAGNLVALATLAEAHPGTRITWAIRGALDRSFGGGTADQLPARGALGLRLRQLAEAGQLSVRAHFRIRALEVAGSKMRVVAEEGAIEDVDEIIAATGARPDLAMARELRLSLDPAVESTAALAPLIDPNLHSCGTVRPHGHRELAHPEEGFYTAGAKSYGRAPNFLLATGYEQVRSIVAALAGDLAAADNVQLELPETGVCTTRALTGEADTGACCAPAPAGSSACCAQPKASAKSCCTPAPAGSASCCVKPAC